MHTHTQTLTLPLSHTHANAKHASYNLSARHLTTARKSYDGPSREAGRPMMVLPDPRAFDGPQAGLDPMMDTRPGKLSNEALIY